MEPAFESMYRLLEGAWIGERQKLEELAEGFDQIEGYQVINLGEIASEYDLTEEELYGYPFMENTPLPTVGRGNADYFIVDEEEGMGSLLGEKEYAAAFSNGRIEVRDKDLWTREKFYNTIDEWREWRSTRELLGAFRPEELQVRKEFTHPISRT